MKKVISIFFLVILFIIPNTIFAQDIGSKDLLYIEGARFSLIEAYDFLLLADRPVVATFYYHSTQIYPYNPSLTIEKADGYYTDLSNLKNYPKVLTGTKIIGDLEIHRDRNKLSEFADIVKTIYLTKKSKNEIGALEDLRITGFNDNGEYKEFNISEYNKSTDDFRISSINFVVKDSNESYWKREEIVYDGVFLYYNIYLDNISALQNTELLYNVKYYNEEEDREDYLNNNSHYIQSKNEYRLVKEILIEGFRQYYIKVLKYPNRENWYFNIENINPYGNSLVTTTNVVYLCSKESLFNDKVAYREKIAKDLEKIHGKDISVIMPSNGAPIYIFKSNDCIMLDYEFPNYTNFYYGEENIFLWSDWGIKDYLLMKYMEERLKDCEYILNFENTFYQKNMPKSTNELSKYLNLKVIEFNEIKKFLKISDPVNEQLYLNSALIKDGQKDYVYNKNRTSINSLNPMADIFVDTAESDRLQVNQFIQDFRYYSALFITILFGIFGLISLFNNYLSKVLLVTPLAPFRDISKEINIEEKGAIKNLFKDIIFALILAIVFFVILISFGIL